MKKQRKQLSKEVRLRQAVSRLTNENARLRKEKKEDKKEILCLKEEVEKLKLIVEELQKIVFKIKNKKDKNNENNNDDKYNDSDSKHNHNGRSKRSATSYQRSKPKQEEITDTQKCEIDNCPDCGMRLTQVRIVERFIEDILPMTEWHKVLKKITKLLITTGYCKKCKKRQEAKPLPKSVVSLGDNIKRFIVFSDIVLQLSYGQIADLLAGTVHFSISDGEIANILEDESINLKAEFERIKKGIRGQPGSHFDETTWNILQHEYIEKKRNARDKDEREKKDYGNYAWVMTGIENSDAIFALGRNRGKRNIYDLAGDGYGGVGVSDDYNGYKNAFKKGKHALCWAHPHRKLKDIKNSDKLSKTKKEHCKAVYEEFAELYKDVREIAQQPFNRQVRLKEKERLIPIFKNVATPHKKDPDKVKRIKSRLLEQMECYFTCITEPNIPPDNNKAERAIRHLVLKRRKSFGGSKTKKGADIMSILYSVILSLWRRDKKNFFSAYDDALSEVV